MGFFNSFLAVWKKIGCISKPRVQETTYSTLPPDQAEKIEAVSGGASHIQLPEEREEHELKVETLKDRYIELPKYVEEEKLKSVEEPFAVASELKEEEEEEEEEEEKSKKDQSPATVPTQQIEELQTARNDIK